MADPAGKLTGATMDCSLAPPLACDAEPPRLRRMRINLQLNIAQGILRKAGSRDGCAGASAATGGMFANLFGVTGGHKCPQELDWEIGGLIINTGGAAGNTTCGGVEPAVIRSRVASVPASLNNVPHPWQHAPKLALDLSFQQFHEKIPHAALAAA